MQLGLTHREATKSQTLAGCQLCPRQCGALRNSERGWCGANAAMEIASVCIHTGEEPPLVGPDGRGIVNVFFGHCNLQCIYCQNGEISGRTAAVPLKVYDAQGLAEAIAPMIEQSAGAVGFVTAAHYADRLPAIVEALHQRGKYPTVVYNSGGYESVATLRSLEGWVDVYLPDYKYALPEVAARYSHAADYPEVAARALEEMARQVGEGLKVAEGVAFRGIIVRHLVLPGQIDNSKLCLDRLAEMFDASKLHLSLMAQYFPAKANLPDALQRTITESEYRQVVEHSEMLGFERGWQQPLEAHANYRPHFTRDVHPFALGEERSEL